MHIPTVTREQAAQALRALGLPVLLWATSRIENDRYQATISDYTRLAGYEVSYAVGVYDRAGTLVARFNVAR